MKLGDNMTMEAYNIWSDILPRKCRPPKIGLIPKHSAIDEESPGSISKSLTVVSSDSKGTSLDAPLNSTRRTIYQLKCSASEQLSSAKLFETKRYSALPTETNEFQFSLKTATQSRYWGNKTKDSCCFEQEAKNAIKRPVGIQWESFVKQSSNPDTLEDRREEAFGSSQNKITIKSPSEESATVAPQLRVYEDSLKIPSSPEDISDQEITEVRKDSALYLEEAEGLPNFREILKCRSPKVARPRRESSGYASNLGTFDEDKRNSSTTDILQDLTLFPKEIRTSSVGHKRSNSRIVDRTEENFHKKVVGISTDRMPTTDIHRNVSTSGLEMANIEEVKEVLRDEMSSRQESLDNLCTLIKHVRAEDLSARYRLMGELVNSDLTSKNNARTGNQILSMSRTCVTTKLEDLPTDVFDTTSLSESINRTSMSPSSRNTLPREVHQHTTPSFSDSGAHYITDDIKKPDHVNDQLKTDINVERSETTTRSNEEIFNIASTKNKREQESSSVKVDAEFKELPRSIKVYQFLSTQSEDRTGDGALYSADRRISFQISKQGDVLPPKTSLSEFKNISLSESENISLLRSNFSNEAKIQTQASVEVGGNSPVRKVSSPEEIETIQKFLGDSSNVTVRPIYPYCPYSPYGSPQGSPRNRRRPLRESRRVSIDNRQGALQLNQYKLLDNIGQGSYGIVKLVYNEEDETHYAMKILSKKKLMKKAGIFGRMAPGRKGAADPLAKVYREIALLKKLDHPNVVKLVEVLDDPDEDNLYLVFELVEKGEILQIPTDKPLDEETARKNFRDVVMGVEYLHYQRIVHRDIKPSNLLVDSDGRIKVADLGVSAELRAAGELLSGPAGTPAFAAPETTTPGTHYSGTLCDVWSMGVTLYALVTGRVPWDGAGSIIGVQAAVRTEPLKFPEKPALSRDLCELISKMLAKDPTDRITLSEIKENAWLTNCGAEPLPSETDNCRLPVTVTDEEVERVVTRIPKLDTLILIKTMLKQHSFQNPFLPKKSGKAACADTAVDSVELSPSGRTEEVLAPRKMIRNSKTEQFQRAGRSNSAPDSYDWQVNGRQMSVDSPLPPVTEISIQEAEIEKR